VPRVIVSEVNAVRALEAVMDGFEVLPMDEAAPIGDLFGDGDRHARSDPHRALSGDEDGAILANSGHFDVELDVAGLREIAGVETEVRANLAQFQLPDGKSLYLLRKAALGEVAAEASPASVMDLSSPAALSARYLLERPGKLTRRRSWTCQPRSTEQIDDRASSRRSRPPRRPGCAAARVRPLVRIGTLDSNVA